MAMIDAFARYAPYTNVCLVCAVSMLLQSWLLQSCTRHEAPPPQPALVQSTAAGPARGDTAVPPAPQTLPVVMAFTDPSACVAFEQDGYPCRWIEHNGAPIGVEVHFAGRERHGLPLAVPGRNAREDWRGFDWLELELENRSAERLKLGLILRNEPGSWQEDQAAGFTLALEAARRVTWRVPLRHLQYTTSGRVWELGGDAGAFRAWGSVDLAHVREVRLTLWNDGAQGCVGLYRAELVGPFDWRGWVDRYGQRKDGTWPRKVNSEAEIIEADEQERSLVDPVTPFAERDPYQAWAKGPKRRATGYFRVERVDGRWWFVAPNGRLFFATGVNVIWHGLPAPINARTAAAYEWLPPRQGPFARAWQGQSVSFHIVNQIRKWGESYEARSRERAIRRQLFWGFTSLGNWSDWELLRGVPQLPRLPYVTYGPNASNPTATAPMQVPYVTDRIQDALHPAFAREARRIAQHALSGFKDDPWVLGHFIDNELDWDKFSERLLAAPDDLPAKQWALAQLAQRYKNIAALNAAWGTTAEGFAALRWPFKRDQTPSAAAARDMRELRGAFAQRWHRAWAQAIRAADPHHLVLGSRIHLGDKYPEVIAACAKYVDVMSLNHYRRGPEAAVLQRIYAIAKKPLFIGEYGHNSLDEGLLTAAVPVASEAERGTGFRYYTEQLAALPYIVGSHYFQYWDEPITGRSDTETAYNGFVNIADIASAPLVAAARATNARIYAVHAGMEAPFAVAPRKP
jgi:Beta-galactosidase